MTEVEAEHIAYAMVQVSFFFDMDFAYSVCTVQACFAISSLNKWKDRDTLFYYADYYTRIVNLIWGRIDGEWVDSLLGHYNE
jgi:hypothetical protein